MPSPAGYFIVSLYKLPGRDSYAGGLSPPSSGRNPSVTMKAFALKDELVDVDHRLCAGADGPGTGGGGSDPPERVEPASSLLLLQVPSVMPPHEELVLGVRELRVENGCVEWCGDEERELRRGDGGLESMSRSSIEGA